ncbi:MAG TPA: transcription termination factor Rho, partial [Pirellulales bacterium]
MNGRSGGYSGGYRRFHDPGPRPPMPEGDLPEGAEAAPPEPGAGVLELHPNGYGFLRNISSNLTRERSDPFVPGTMIEKYRLREGVLINGMVQHSRRQQGP